MPSELLRVDPDHPAAALIAQAAQRLARGEVVAFPTETVYGLGAHGLDPEAVARIYAAKGRPAWNPLILHVPDVEGARALTRVWPDSAARLASAFWPGPLTLVLPKHARVPDIVTAGLDAVGVRVPAHPVALALLRALGAPIAAPSANRFTHVSPTTAQHVIASLGERVSCVVDGGSCHVGIESTVVDLTGAVPVMLRPGAITRAQLAEVLGQPVAVVEHMVSSVTNVAAQRSPGMADRHYAPRADVWLFDPSQADEIADALAARRAHARFEGRRNLGTVTALLLEMPLALDDEDQLVRMPTDPSTYAQRLYAALHAADARGASLVLIERPPASDHWNAVRDRLARAAR